MLGPLLTKGDGADHSSKALQSVLLHTPHVLQRLWTLSTLLLFRPLSSLLAAQEAALSHSLKRATSSDPSWWAVRFIHAAVLRPAVWLLTRPFRFTRVRVALLLLALVRLIEWLRTLDRTYRSLSTTGSAARLQTPGRSASASLARPFPVLPLAESQADAGVQRQMQTASRNAGDEDLGSGVKRALFVSQGLADSSVSFGDIPLVLPSRAKVSSRSLRLAPALRKSVIDSSPAASRTRANSVFESQDMHKGFVPGEMASKVDHVDENREIVRQKLSRDDNISLYSATPITTESLESEMDSIRASLRSEIDRVKKLNEEKIPTSKSAVARKSNAKILRQQYEEVLQMQIQGGITTAVQPPKPTGPNAQDGQDNSLPSKQNKEQ